jgi:SAM-dependent methyltransferase
MVGSQTERDRWDARFASDEYAYGTEPNRFLQAQQPLLPPSGRALSVADGEGRNGIWLARQGLQVTAVEFSQVAIDKARHLAAHHGVALDSVCADLAAWDWGEARFEVVVGIFFQFAAPPLRARLFAEMQRVLLPGGLLRIEGYTPRQLEHDTGGPRQVENLYTLELLRSAFAALEIMHLAEHETDLSEGRYHLGRSAVVDLVARKPAPA